MTHGLRALQKRLAVVLEGGYDLNALRRSSEAVVRTLQINQNDTNEINKLIEELAEKPGLTLSQLETSS
jgi:acetoin utilization deacetylase AcuC-like enzyme